MPDIEKVIKGLECHAEVNCVECPYRDGWRTCPFGETLLADALVLLKEQEQTIDNLNETVKNLLQQIIDIKEYMTPYGKVKDIKAYAELLKEQPLKPDWFCAGGGKR